MHPESVERSGLVRFLLFVSLLAVLLGTLMQLELPTIETVGEALETAIVERQLQLQRPAEEDLLKTGWIYFNIGRYDEAERIMKSITEKEQNISALYCLGLISIKHGRFAEAVSRLEPVAAKSPGHAGTRVYLGRAYYELGYYTRAANVSAEAVELDPVNEEARLWLGKAYLRLNQTRKAIDILETVTHGREAVEAAALMKNLR